MKLSKLVLLLPVLVAACNQPPVTTEQLHDALDGRWVFNSAYCQRMLPEDGLADYKIEDTGIRTGGVLATGQWFRPAADEVEKLDALITEFVKDNAKTCKESLPDSKPAYIVFESYEQKFVLAYFHDVDTVFRIIDDTIVAGRRYDSEMLRSLAAE